jgi:hypothetical protein
MKMDEPPIFTSNEKMCEDPCHKARGYGYLVIALLLGINLVISRERQRRSQILFEDYSRELKRLDDEALSNMEKEKHVE